MLIMDIIEVLQKDGSLKLKKDVVLAMIDDHIFHYKKKFINWIMRNEP